MSLKKSKILIDVDDVIVGNVFIPALNKFKETSYETSDFKSFFLNEFLEEKEFKEFIKFLGENNMYENCDLIDHAYEVLEHISKAMDVYICSSCVVYGASENSGVLFSHKYNFLINKFPFLDPEKFIFTAAKNNFSGFDYQIDDRIENLQGKIKHKLLFTAFHNVDINDEELSKQNIFRVNNWFEAFIYIYNIEVKKRKMKFWPKRPK